VSCWPATPLPSPVLRATCQVRDWHSSWHALTDGLAFILALALCWPSTPTPTSGVHDTLRSRSLVFTFGVLCICVWGPSRSRLWPRICHICGLVFVFVFMVPHVHVRVHGPLHSCLRSLAFVFMFAVPCVRVHNGPLAFIVFTTAPSLALTCVGYI
jgi:hypothetical protein